MNSGACRPLKNNTGACSRSSTSAAAGIDHLPGQVALPFLFDVAGQVGQIAAMMVPIVARAVLQLGHQHRAAALGQKQQRKAGADMRIGFSACPCPFQKPDKLSWLRTSMSAPSRYQSCWPMKRRAVMRPVRSTPYR